MSGLEITYILKWWLLFFLIGITFLPTTFLIFNRFIDKGYIFSKILGLLLITYTFLTLSSLKIFEFSTMNLILIWILVALPQLLILKKKNIFNNTNIKLIIIEEIVFLACIFLWSYLKGFNPDIHDLEKFMDYGFINSILRSDYLPPRDMWFSPLSINYYYFGHLYTAITTQLSTIPSHFTFNIMLSTIFAFTFTLSFSIGINLVNQIKKLSTLKLILSGIIFSYVVSLSGNLQTIYAFFNHYDSEWPKPFWELGLAIFSFPNSYWYPSATRFIYHTIHEFPSYSFVVADLHGHVLSIPIVLSMIAIFLLIFIEKRIKIYIILLLGFLLSAAYMTNAWDGLIYLGLSIITFTIVYFYNFEGEFKKRIKYAILNLLKSTFIVFVAFFIFSYIFNSNFDPFASSIGLNCSPNFLTNIGNVGPIIFEEGFCQATPFWQLLILYGFFIFMLVSLLIFLRNKKLLSTDLFVLSISLFSLLLILTPEIIYLKDIYTGHFRANTMFKLSYQAFIMLSFASIYTLFRIGFEIKKIKKKSVIKKLSYLVFILSFAILFSLIIIYPYFAVPSGYKDLNERKDLNGIKYLDRLYPSDYEAILWINDNIIGQPVILEAQGDSYTNYGRISANTGLPTVLGWTVHEWLWRGSYDIPAARFEDITTIYESTDIEKVQELIKEYDITYVYVGQLENEKYEINQESLNTIGKIIFSSLNSDIYKIN